MNYYKVVEIKNMTGNMCISTVKIMDKYQIHTNYYNSIFTSSSGFAFSFITLTLSLHFMGILDLFSSLLDPFDDFSLLDAAA